MDVWKSGAFFEIRQRRLRAFCQAYNAPMKAYVNYFDTDGARARAKVQWDDIRDDETVVQFNKTPDHWKMGLIEAQSCCDVLNRAQIYAAKWPQHLCHLEVEEVGTGEYAIVCTDHPALD
jgi:hypothetical protein